MLPVEILITEHRLIEKMVTFIGEKIKTMAESRQIDSNFIVLAVDFFRTYADRYHHGKEEGILFKELSTRKLSEEDYKLMFELIMEHALARKTVTSLVTCNNDYLSGKTQAITDILAKLKVLVDLYPRHIQKEDQHFFYPVMKYFTAEEQGKMLEAFNRYDREFTNKRYEQVVKNLNSTL